MASRSHCVDGTQQKIIESLQGALEQANAELASFNADAMPE